MNGTAKQAGNSARDLAQKIAKQMAQEPLEVLKTASEQIVGPEIAHPQENSNSQNQEKASDSGQKLLDQMKSGRRMEALNQELKDMHKQELFADLQARISEGEEVPLTDYGNLSMEQKQVLNAQMEAVKAQRQQAQNAQDSYEVPSISSKPSRRFGAGQKHEAEKQQTRVEKPVPPSG
jgi:hypothetical protein